MGRATDAAAARAAGSGSGRAQQHVRSARALAPQAASSSSTVYIQNTLRAQTLRASAVSRSNAPNAPVYVAAIRRFASTYAAAAPSGRRPWPRARWSAGSCTRLVVHIFDRIVLGLRREIPGALGHASSSVTSMPPPPVVMILLPLKLKHAMSPRWPTGVPDTSRPGSPSHPR